MTAVVLALCVLLFKPLATAQTQTTGSISGRVYDAETASRPGLPDARLILLDQETGVRRSVLTGNRGEYFFDLLMPSRYQLSCELEGYESLSGTQRNILVFIATRRELKMPPFEMRRLRRPVSPVPVPAVSQALISRASIRFEASSRSSDRPASAPWRWRELARSQGEQQPPGSQPPKVPANTLPSDSQSAKLVHSLSATRGGHFTDSQLLSLPLEGIRTFDALALLLPGVVSPPQTVSTSTGPGIGPSVGTAGQFSVNGLRSRGNNFTIDGSDNNDEDIGVRRQGFTSLIPQSIESIKQFQISTLLAEPPFGRSFGAQANAVSRSGASRVHGMAYGYITDRQFNARNFFDQSAGSFSSFPVPRSASDPSPVFLDSARLTQPNLTGGENAFTRSQAGFVLGGPLRQQKSHFFIAFEHQDINASRESHFAVPTVAQRGIFETGANGLETRFTAGSGEFSRLFYPTTAFGDAVFSLFPWPNNPLGPYGANTRTEILPADADGAILSLKADHRGSAFGKEHTLSGRFNFSKDDTVLPVTGQALFSTLQAQVRTWNLSLVADSTLSSQSSNQLRFSYGRTVMRAGSYPNGLTGAHLPGLTSTVDAGSLLSAPLLYNLTQPTTENPATAYRSYSSLQQAGFIGLPAVNGTEAITGPIGQVLMTGFSPLGVDVFNFPQQRANNTFQLADTLIVNRQRLHRIVAGFDLRRSHLNSFLDRNSRSQMVFSGAPNLNQSGGVPNELFRQGQVLSNTTRTSPFFTGADFAAVGAATGFFQTLKGPEAFGTIGLRYWQNDAFFSDQLRLRQNLSVTLGLRYGLNTVPKEVNQRIERSFQSREVAGLIAAEKQESQKAGRPAVSGFETFLSGRTEIFPGDRNNFAPYAAFAWDPFGTGMTALRGGFGIYYDQIPGAVTSQSRNVFPNFLTLNLGGYRSDTSSQLLLSTNPQRFAQPGSLDRYDLNGSGGSDLVAFMLDTARRTNNGSGPAFFLPSAQLRTPVAWHWALNAERELGSNLLVSLAYVGTRSQHLLRLATPNLGPNVIPTVLEVNSSRPAGTEPIFLGVTVPPGTSVIDLGSRLVTSGRPFPLLGSFTSIESDANSSYHSFQSQLNRRFASSLQFTTAYTWSHAIDEVSDLFDLAGGRSLPQSSRDRRSERGHAGFDVRHRFAGSFTWDVPLFARSRFLGGWQLAGIATLQGGQPFTILAPFDLNLDGNLTDRVNGRTGFREVNRGPIQFEFSQPLSQLPAIGANGREGRNTFRGPGIATLDLAARKRFQFTESHYLEVRTDFFNLFNRTHFGLPVHQIGFPAFGQSTNTLVPARVIQFALRLGF